jgi:hypothetical protein
MNKVAVILINYNSAKYTIECIESIWAETSPSLNYEIIVVDNKSKPDDLSIVDSFVDSAKKSNLKLIKSKINTGFGGGNMMGAQAANASYYAFVNNDSIFKNDCLSLLLNAMESNENYGVCGPKAYKEDGSILPTLDHYTSLSKEFIGRKLLEKINPKKYPNRKKEYTNHQKGQFVSGSFMMVKSVDFWNVGGFDTNIFLYHEETDLCKRINKLNKYSFLIPEAEFIHYHGASTPKSIAIKTELKLSQLYVIRKHYGYCQFKTLLTFFQIKYFISSIVKPKYWSLFFILLKGAHLSDSLKQKQ